MSLNYRNISDFIKELATSDPRLHEGLSRIDKSLEELYKAVNAIDTTKQARYSCALGKVGNQSYTDATFAPVQWDKTDQDNGSIHSDTVNNSRLTVPVPGLWLIGYSLAWVNNVTNDRLGRIDINGIATSYYSTAPHTITAGVELVINGSALLDMR